MEMKELMGNMANPGRVEWIGIRPTKKAELESVNQVVVRTDSGLEGDHYHGRSGQRQVTLISAEHLEAVAKFMGVDHIDPSQTRRNVLVSGINLTALKEKTFTIGQVVLETTGPCAPCSQMEKNLGYGGYNAMRGHGGICAKVVQGGEIAIGDEVRM